MRRPHGVFSGLFPSNWLKHRQSSTHWLARLFGFRSGDLSGGPVAGEKGASTKAAPPERRRQFSESLEPRQFLSAAVSFAPAELYPGDAGSMAVGDFNGDGKPDIVTVSPQDNTVVVRINAGNGTFLPPQTYYTFNPQSVCVGDFNGDGHLDMAVASSNFDTSSVSIFYGLGDGTFVRPPTVIPVGYPVRYIESADMNGDGRPDLVIAAFARILVLLNEGNGTFAPAVPYSAGPGECGQFVIGDFNGDGIPDIADVRRNIANNIVSILLGEPGGTLSAPELFKVGVAPKAIAEGDLNGDGKLDLVISNSEFRVPSLEVLQGNGDGTFAPKESYYGGNFVDGVAIGDFTGSGHEDIATVSFTSGLRVYPNNGDGTFGPLVYFPGARYGQFVVAADFTGDGMDDIALVNGGGLKVLLNTTPAAPPPGTPTSIDVAIGDGNARSVTWVDSTGYTSTISLNGPGSASIEFTGANLSTNATGTRILGGEASLTTITATGTTAATTLAITPLGRNSRISLGTLTSDGAFGSISAARVNLAGNITIAGTVGSLTLNNAKDGTISLNSAGPATRLTLATVTDESVTSSQPIGTLAVGQWYSTPGISSQISAPAISRINAFELFGASMNVGSGGLGSLTALGITSGTWNIAGPVGNINVARGAQFNLTAPSLSHLFAGLVLNNVNLNIAGNIGSITADGLTNSTVFAGVGPLPTGQLLPTASSDLVASSSIGSIMLFRRPGISSFANSAIAAASLPHLRLGIIAFTSDITPYGIAARSVGMLNGTDYLTHKTFMLQNPVNLAVLTAEGIGLQDFALNIL